MVSKKAYLLNPEDLMDMYSYLTALYAGFRFEEILDFTIELDQQLLPVTDDTPLTELLKIVVYNGPHKKFGIALDRLDFVLHAIERTLATAERKQDNREIALQRMMLADFKYRQADSTQEAMKIFEQVLDGSA